MRDRAKQPGCSALAGVPAATPGREWIHNLAIREGLFREFEEATTIFSPQRILVARLRGSLRVSDGVGVVSYG